MSALYTIVYFAVTIWVARIMYGRWRKSILNRAMGSSTIYSKEFGANVSVTSRLVWAGLLSFFITLAALPFVGITMLVMHKPPKTDSEKQQEQAELERRTRLETQKLNALLEQSRIELAEFREQKK